LDASPAPVVSVGADGFVIRWNDACERLFGLDRESVLGREMNDVLRFEARASGGGFPERQWAVTAGRRVAVELTSWVSSAADERVDHYWLRDSTLRVSYESHQEEVVAALRRQARSDALTGLANRFELEERLTAAVSGGPNRIALVAVDLDGFKPINDSYGHFVGDEVLAAVAARLLKCVRADDTVARVGGDEFVVLARLAPGADPSELTARIRRALARPLATSAGLLHVGGSIGVALSEHGQEPADLLRRADKAMYRVKLSRSDPTGRRA
jgi:diguanylate cyclase (GGDEF)-like protein